MSEYLNKAKSIFLAAIDEHPRDRWPVYLEQACAGNAPLRAEVDNLRRAHVKMGSFHEVSRSAVPETVEYPIAEGPGATIGAYRLLEQIGEGGFGVVFMAEQQKPIQRKVAIKVLKPGMDTRQVLARFESERQALALMEHVNIAKVLDAGATDCGRPYFVMELVKGVPITEFCDDNRLSLEARLRLVVDVCLAIQHAHHKGIIHRDIKPSNILVTLRDGEPVVKVIDFGVAKATLQKLTERTLFTAFGQMIGTPEYMSPEQADRGGLDIDTRSDVYALGALLFELLTGTTPLGDKRLREASYVEIQRLIREEEAPRPSTLLSTLRESATPLAEKRGLDVKSLVQLLAADLDWLVLKALEKDRNRRYDSPRSLAEDIDRYLRGEAIVARPQSTTYRLKKFTQRHRASVLTGIAMVSVLLTGSTVATWQAVVATRSNHVALAAVAAETAAKELAQAREAETKAVLEFVENRIFSATRPAGQQGGLGREVTIRRAVESALPFVQSSFPNHPLIEARLRLTLGQTFAYLGEGRIAAEQCATARTLYGKYLGPGHPETLRSMNNLARSYRALGRYADALKLSEETLQLCKANLGPDHPDTLRSMNCLACCYADLGWRLEALSLREKTLALMKAMLGPDHPDTLQSMYNLAISLGVLGRSADALRLREETLTLRKAKLGPEHPDTLRSMNGVACGYAALGRHADAVELYEKTVERQKVKLGPDHPDTFQTMYNLAISYSALGRHTDSLKLREETLALHVAKLGAEHPRTLTTMNALASSYSALGRHVEALALYERTLALQKATLGPDHRDTICSTWGVVNNLVKLDRGTEAVVIIDECVRRTTSKVIASRPLAYMMDLRLRHFERSRDAAGCAETADLWENLQCPDTDSQYAAARMRAVTARVLRLADKSPAATQRAAAEADRAMEWLKKAVAGGSKHAARIKQDKDFDALRDRPDFANLLGTLRTPPAG
jgi:non-specific serine/threonine protein kinase/serine/threonine-protein kinase